MPAFGSSRAMVPTLKKGKKMKTVTLYREDFYNELHPEIFDYYLEKLGIETHVVVDGKRIEREIDQVDIMVLDATVT